jgi:hypothetical protein
MILFSGNFKVVAVFFKTNVVFPYMISNTTWKKLENAQHEL